MKIKSPVINSFDTSPNTQNLLSGTSLEKTRKYIIFELKDLRHENSALPQSMPIFPYMVLHINPDTFDESYTKLINRQATRGGFLEQHWGEELTDISCSGTTGSFITLQNGLSVLNRKTSIAYLKYKELLSIYKNNGLVYDQRGNVIFECGLNMHFNGNIYTGYFENFITTESSDKPFSFSFNFTFKVKTQYRNVGY